MKPEINKIYQGDTLEVLKSWPDDFVDMVITSPPYYRLRNYGVDGQLGLEKTFEEYLGKMLEITKEIKRVLKKTGSFWLNFGDAYGSDASLCGNGDKVKQGVSNRDFSFQNKYDEYKDISLSHNPDKFCPVHGQFPEPSEKNHFHNEDQNDHLPNEDFSHEKNRKISAIQGQGQVLNSKHAFFSSAQKSKISSSSDEFQENVSNRNHESISPSMIEIRKK